MNNKKVLILYASAGAGHKKAAEALYNSSKGRPGQFRIIDIVDYLPPPFKFLYTKGYIFLITRLTWIWGILYFLSDARILSLLNVNLRKFLNALMSRRFISFLLAEKPDIVISTQFFASEIVSYVKVKFHLDIRLVTVVTDFGVHNFWISEKTDIYCCASESTKGILMEKGIKEDMIQVTGIPVDEKFSRPQDTDAILSEMKLKKGVFSALVVTGGIGAGPIEKIVELLKGEVQLLVICGYNKKLYNSLAHKKYENVRLFGFVDYIEKLMRVSDLIITKAGGLTVTESLVVGLPMVFFLLIPGQEMTNARVMEALGTGIIANSPQDVKEIVLKLKNDSHDLNARKQKASSLGIADSSSKVISLLDALS